MPQEELRKQMEAYIMGDEKAISRFNTIIKRMTIIMITSIIAMIVCTYIIIRTLQSSPNSKAAIEERMRVVTTRFDQIYKRQDTITGKIGDIQKKQDSIWIKIK